VAGKCVFINTCNLIFLQHCIEHLYFWYHNMLLQLQHTCHKLLHYFIAGNYITNWFIISCDNYNECFHLLDSFEKWSVMHLCISGMNLASLKIFLLKFGTGTVQTVVFFVFVLFFNRIQYRPWYFQERYCLRLYGMFVRIPKKHYGTKICSFMEIFCCLLLYSSMFCWQWSCFILFWRWDEIINIGSLKRMSSVGHSGLNCDVDLCNFIHLIDFILSWRRRYHTVSLAYSTSSIR
jgi:hypothetical protein